MDQGGTLAKRSRFSEEQIIAVLKEQKAGPKTGDICRRHGISHATFYAWRKKHGGTEVSDARRLKALEEENARLKRIVADQTLDLAAMKDLLAKKLMTPMAKRNAMGILQPSTACHNAEPAGLCSWLKQRSIRLRSA